MLRIKEAFCIATAEHQKSLNRDQGTAISDCWKPLLQCWKQQRVARQPTVGDKCSNHAFYSTPSVSGLFVYSDEGYSMVAEMSVHYSFHSLVSRVNI